MLHLSMNELTTMRWSFEEDIHHYSDAGLEGVGIWREKLSDVGDEAAVQLLRDANLRCSNLLWAGGFTGSHGCSFRDSVHDAIEAIRSAALLEADCLILYSGAWGGHTKQHARRLVRNGLRELIPFAEEFGVTLAIEPMHAGCGSEWTFLTTVRETLALIDPFESPFLKLALDTYHFGLQDEDVAQLANIAHRIGIVHLGDGRDVPCGEQDRCRLGKGCVPLQQIIETLTAAGYSGFLDIELIGESVESIDYVTLIRESIEFAQGLVSVS